MKNKKTYKADLFYGRVDISDSLPAITYLQYKSLNYQKNLKSRYKNYFKQFVDLNNLELFYNIPFSISIVEKYFSNYFVENKKCLIYSKTDGYDWIEFTHGMLFKFFCDGSRIGTIYSIMNLDDFIRLCRLNNLLLYFNEKYRLII